ncbi:MAG: 50S ribosome-binding protein YggL [Pseudomonadota bacterium]
MYELINPSQRRLRGCNTRQRKKLHLGEFRQLRGDISLRFKQPMDGAAFEAWVATWITWVESQHLYIALFGGALPIAGTDGMLLAEKSLTQEQLDAACAWLKANPEVAEITRAELRDAYYAEFGD